MAESLMLIALGFLTATLFAIVAVQLAWRRAVTVTTEKMRGELNLDEVEQTAARLVEAEAALEDKRAEASELAARNAELEERLATASAEAQTMQSEIADLHGHYETAQGEARRQADELAALHSHAAALQTEIGGLRQRVAELETAATAEINRQLQVEAQLRQLGERATRLVSEMNEAFAHAAKATGLHSAMAASEASSATHPAEEPATLSPYPVEVEDGTDMRQLDAIKASLASFSESVKPDAASYEDADEQDEDAPLPNESFLAERIRALEAGVAPHR